MCGAGGDGEGHVDAEVGVLSDWGWGVGDAEVGVEGLTEGTFAGFFAVSKEALATRGCCCW